ncbi:MAG: type II toxin-antitoxin system VapC family toxin [Solirubrobacteraceae bacterium]
MILPDVNILIYAHREELPQHAASRAWLDEVVDSDEPYGLSELVLSGFLRIVTNPRALVNPTPMDVAQATAERWRNRRNCVVVRPGPRHWGIFMRLCRDAGAKGNLVPDAYLAALAIESGSEWITTDRGFARFPGLRWRHPLEEGRAQSGGLS